MFRKTRVLDKLQSKTFQYEKDVIHLKMTKILVKQRYNQHEKQINYHKLDLFILIASFLF